MYSFPVPLVVRAEDGDEQGTVHSEVRYQILPSSPGASNFSVDSVSGEVRPTGFLDFEELPETGADPADRVIKIQIRDTIGRQANYTKHTIYTNNNIIYKQKILQNANRNNIQNLHLVQQVSIICTNVQNLGYL